MEQPTYNLWYFITSAAMLTVFAVSAVLALVQLRHIKRTRDVEFLHIFDEKLVTQEFSKGRAAIYDKVPCPTVSTEKEAHDHWVAARRKDGDLFEKIQTQLYEFDRMGLFLDKARIDSRLALDLWFDVIVRLTVLLQFFVAEERRIRGRGYMVNFIRLTRKNYNFINKHYRRREFRLYRQSKPIEGSVPISLAELANAVAFLEGN